MTHCSFSELSSSVTCLNLHSKVNVQFFMKRLFLATSIFYSWEKELSETLSACSLLAICYSGHQCFQASLLLRCNFKFTKPPHHAFSKPTLLIRLTSCKSCSFALGKHHLAKDTECLSTPKAVFPIYI